MTDAPLKSIADPKTHYGSGRKATRSFMVQRLTAMLNVLFTGFFIWFVVRLAGTDRVEMIMVIRRPVIAILLGLMIVNVCVHMRIGANEMLEDYITDHAQNRLLRMLNTLFAAGVALVTIIAVAKIAFWG